MERMSFKGTSWPRNPETYCQSYEREPVYTKNSSGEAVFSKMGPLKLTVTGTGTFTGTTAYSDFQVLAGLFSQTTVGALYHPIWGVTQAYFTELELTQAPRENYVAYRFTFRGADENGKIPQ